MNGVGGGEEQKIRTDSSGTSESQYQGFWLQTSPGIFSVERLEADGRDRVRTRGRNVFSCGEATVRIVFTSTCEFLSKLPN